MLFTTFFISLGFAPILLNATPVPGRTTGTGTQRPENPNLEQSSECPNYEWLPVPSDLGEKLGAPESFPENIAKGAKLIGRGAEGCAYRIASQNAAAVVKTPIDPRMSIARREVNALKAINQFYGELKSQMADNEPERHFVYMEAIDGGHVRNTKGWLENVSAKGSTRKDADIPRQDCTSFMETVYKAVAQAAADNVAQYGINHNDYTFGNVLFSQQWPSDGTQPQFIDWGGAVRATDAGQVYKDVYEELSSSRFYKAAYVCGAGRTVKRDS